jgi:hypothetical protein
MFIGYHSQASSWLSYRGCLSPDAFLVPLYSAKPELLSEVWEATGYNSFRPLQPRIEGRRRYRAFLASPASIAVLKKTGQMRAANVVRPWGHVKFKGGKTRTGFRPPFFNFST